VIPLKVNGKIHGLPVSGPDTVKHVLLLCVVVVAVVVDTVVGVVLTVVVEEEVVVVVGVVVVEEHSLVLHTGTPWLSQTQVLHPTV